MIQATNRDRWYRQLYFNYLTHFWDKVNIVHLATVSVKWSSIVSLRSLLRFPYVHVYVRFTKLVLILRFTTYDLRQVTSPIMEVKRYIVSYILYKMIELRWLTPFQQYFSYIMATSFSGGRSRREPPTSNW